jgi:hypothetical protein
MFRNVVEHVQDIECISFELSTAALENSAADCKRYHIICIRLPGQIVNLHIDYSNHISMKL